MPFSPVPEKEKYESNFKKTEFIKLVKGDNVIRILDDDYRMYPTHFVPGRGSVLCLGKDECPICQNNKKLIVENPQNFRNMKGYLARSDRYYFNVLDRSTAKVCPKCGNEVKAVNDVFPKVCDCGTVVAGVEAQPVNKVKVLNKTSGLVTLLVAFEHKYGLLTSYDISLFIADPNAKVPPTPIPLTNQNDVVEVNPEDKYDLDNVLMKLSAEEIEELLRGVSVKDIYKARKGSEDKELEEQANVDADEIQKQVNDLFSK